MDNQPSLRLNHWLQQVGFVHGDPFATNEADREHQLLREFFVDTGYYDLIWGDPAQPQTALVFAPRGGGKSAHRLMVQGSCRPASSKSTLLAIPYLSCETHLARMHDQREIRVQDHLAAILRNGLAALVEAASQSAELAVRFTPPLCSRLTWYCRQYAPDVISPLAILRGLRLNRGDVNPPWREFQQRVRKARLTEGLARWGLLDGPVAAFLADLVDAVPEPLETPEVPSLIFTEFITLIRNVGLSATYVLIDRWDEASETADQPRLLADILSPLLADLLLAEAPGAAFKIFLPESLQELLKADPAVRFDRFRSYEIRWSDDLVRQMLNKRLVAYSEGKIRSLAQICTSALADSIERQIVWWAGISPRRLLKLGEAFVLAHVRRANAEDLILSSQDWDEACRNVLSGHLPRLRVDSAAPQAFVGRRPIALSTLEHRFLHNLARSGGWCEKEKLIARVWDTQEGVTDQAISQLVRRIREKIEPSPGSPVYLMTEYGLGFRLENIATPGRLAESEELN